MHSQNVSHRDLKAENLLLNASGALKIADLGLFVVAQGPEEMLETRCDTPNRIASELSNGAAYYGRP